MARRIDDMPSPAFAVALAILGYTRKLAELVTLILLICKLTGATQMSYFWVFFPCILQVVALGVYLVAKTIAVRRSRRCR